MALATHNFTLGTELRGQPPRRRRPLAFLDHTLTLGEIDQRRTHAGCHADRAASGPYSNSARRLNAQPPNHLTGSQSRDCLTQEPWEMPQ